MPSSPSASRRVAAWFAGLGMARGDRVLVMLDNQVELWETILACIRLGAVVIPTATQLTPADLRDRIERGAVRFVVTRSTDAAKFDGYAGGWTPIAVGGPVEGWKDFAETRHWLRPGPAVADTEWRRHPAALLHSGTTARPKLVEHTHASYPVGHLSTMYWIGLQPGDVHLNVASPGGPSTPGAACSPPGTRCDGGRDPGALARRGDPARTPWSAAG